MLEKDFASQLEYLLDLNGWKWTHFRPAMRQSGTWSTPLSGDKGFPDYVAVRPPRLLFAEIKSSTGRATREQIAWLEDLGESGAESYLWHPEDFPRILETLR
jgi:hypothetical protein